MTMPGADVSSAVAAPVRADLVVQGPLRAPRRPRDAAAAHRRRRHRASRARAMRRVPSARARGCCRRRGGVRAQPATTGRSCRAQSALARVRLVAMDMDSTLITIECIDEIAALRGIGDDVAAITAAAMRGEIDFRAKPRAPRRAARGPARHAISRASTTSGCSFRRARALLDGCARIGAKTLLVSGGFTFFTDRLQARLALDYTLRERARDRRRPAHRAASSATSSTRTRRRACFANLARSLPRRRRPRGRDRRRRERPADARTRRRLDRLSRQAARARAADARDRSLRTRRGAEPVQLSGPTTCTACSAHRQVKRRNVLHSGRCAF